MSAPSTFSEGVDLERCGFAAEGFRTRLRVRSLSGGNSPRGFFVYPAAGFFCWKHARQRPGPGPNTYTPRSHTRGFDSYSYFDVRVSKIIPHFFRAFPLPVRAVAGVGAFWTGVASQSRGIFLWFRCCSVHLRAVGGSELAPRHRTMYSSLGCCSGTSRVCFVLTRDGPVLALERSGSAPRGRQGKSFFCACVSSHVLFL